VAVDATAAGDLRVTPFGTAMPLASILNYAGGVSGLNLANGLVVTLCDPATTTCTLDITLQADASAIHVVADVQGYFRAPVFGLPTRTQGQPIANIAGSCGSGGSLTYTAPRAGKLLVRLDMAFRLTHNNGTQSEGGARVGTTAADCTFIGNGNIFVSLPGALPSDTYYLSHSVAKLFDVVAGANTFYVNAFKSSGTVAIFSWAADATFTPD
jgi:hypothetical protein